MLSFKSLAITIVGIFLLLTFFSHSSATTYYVKNDGDDDSSGTSEQAAWEHVVKACTTLVAGDTVLIRAGTYDEQPPSPYQDECPSPRLCGTLRPKNSGTSGNRIVYKGYPGDAKPIIEGSGYVRYAVYLGGKSYITLDSLEVRYSYRGITISGGASYVTIKNCNVHHTAGPPNNNNGGVMLGFSPSNNIVVQGCSLYHNWSASAGDTVSDQNCSGIHAYRTKNSLFEDNVIWDMPYGNGIFLKWIDTTCVVRRNVAYGCNKGFRVGTAVDDCDIYENITYDGNETAIPIEFNSDEEISHVRVWNNVVYNYPGGIKIFDSFGGNGNSECTDCQFWNNIVFNVDNENWKVKEDNHPNLWSDYNSFYDDFENIVVQWHNTNYTLAQYQSLTGLDQHSIQQDPMFVNPPYDFHLLPNSPCRGVGLGGVDMGAYPDTTPSGPDTDPPDRSNGAPTGNLPAGTTQTTISLNTNEAATCRYSTTPGIPYNSMTNIFSNTGGTAHSTLVSGLSNGNTYSYCVRCQDTVGNANTDDYIINFSVEETVAGSECDNPRPEWILCDDFEDGVIDDLWLVQGSEGEAVINTDPINVYQGDGSLEATGYAAPEAGPHLITWFMDNTNPEIHVRWYVKFASDFDQGPAMHFVILYGNRMDNPWSAFGQAGNHPNGTNFYCTDLDITKDYGAPAPGEMIFYTYHMDKPGSWGEVFRPSPPYPIDRDRWYEMEMALFANTPGQNDGWQAFWIDDSLILNVTGLRWRETLDLQTNALEIGLYLHNPSQVNRVWYDNVVVSTEKIGLIEGASTDTTPPVISNVQSSGITHNSATISWDTDEPATSQVQYSLDLSWSTSTTFDPTLATSHSQVLPELNADTTYHYRVISIDSQGNETISSDYTFTTAGDSTNLNIAWGITASVDGTYPGYTITPITEGVIDPYGGTATTWCSDTSSILPHWVIIDFGEDCRVNNVTIYWAWNDYQSQWMTPSEYHIQRWDGSDYLDVVTVTDAPVGSVTVTTFPELTTSRIRVYQPANMGPESYPTIIWLTELEIYGLCTDVMDSTYQLALEYPLQNDTIPTIRPTLVARLVSGSSEIDLLSCQFDVSEDPGFSNNVLSSDRMPFSVDRTARWGVTQDLKQNTRFYWRAKLYLQDRLLDITQTFTVFTGTIHVFPNPFKPSLGHSHVTFRNIPLNSTIRVTTISGDLVKTFNGTQRTDVMWDVKTEEQKELASGVYLYWVSHAGKVSSGKIFVIR